MVDIDQLIEMSLKEARTVIQGGGAWEPMVRIVHPLGVESMRVPVLHADRTVKAKTVEIINHVLSTLNGTLTITVADVWIGDDTPTGFVAISWEIPFSNRRKALVVEVKACCDRMACGIQKYTRTADGQVQFGEFTWGDPLT